MGEAQPPRTLTLAEKLDHLFRTMHPRNRGEVSYAEVAEGIRAGGGPSISASYLWELRTGRADNPTKRHLEALADYFGVNPSYFFDEEAAQRIEEQLDMLAALRDVGVRAIALRSSGLSPEGLAAIRGVIEHVRRVEGLPNGEDSPEEETE
jgi:transcriptional regulator with XRE-family HTH domain